MNNDSNGEVFLFAVVIGAFLGADNAILKGGDLGDIFLGALIEGVIGGLGARVRNLAASASFFSGVALSVSGFGVGFSGGFVSCFLQQTQKQQPYGQRNPKIVLHSPPVFIPIHQQRERYRGYSHHIHIRDRT